MLVLQINHLLAVAVESHTKLNIVEQRIQLRYYLNPLLSGVCASQLLSCRCWWSSSDISCDNLICAIQESFSNPWLVVSYILSCDVLEIILLFHWLAHKSSILWNLQVLEINHNLDEEMLCVTFKCFSFNIGYLFVSHSFLFNIGRLLCQTVRLNAGRREQCSISHIRVIVVW